MIRYRVLYTKHFHTALDAQIEYFLQQDAPPRRISGWLTELLDLLDRLDFSPQQFPVAEQESALRGIELRKVVFGYYLIFYHIDEKRREVQLLGFRHGARVP